MTIDLQPTSETPPPAAALVSWPPLTGAAQENRASRFKSFMQDTDRFLREIHVPAVANVSFEVNGIPFHARHTPQGAQSHLLIWGLLGYLPYSVVSHAKRESLISILEGTQSLPHVKFGVDPQMRIIVVGEYQIATPPSPDYLFVPLAQLMQEVSPFVGLIGEFL